MAEEMDGSETDSNSSEEDSEDDEGNKEEKKEERNENKKEASGIRSNQSIYLKKSKKGMKTENTYKPIIKARGTHGMFVL